MIDAVTSENAHQYADELRETFALRHRIFVERLGWETLRKPDGIEIDQFDTEDAVYLILTKDGRVIGCHRLLPTMKPHLLSEVFPHVCDVKGIPRGPNIYEVTRTCVDLERLSSDECRWARQAIMIGLMEYCVHAGIEKLSVITAPHYVSHYLRCGWKILPLGVPTEIDGETQVAIEIYCTPEGVQAMRDAYDFREPVLRLMARDSPASYATNGAAVQVKAASVR